MALCFCLCVSVFSRELGPCPENLRAPVAFRPLGLSLSELIGSFDVPNGPSHHALLPVENDLPWFL
jgi:hypothetical protein